MTSALQPSRLSVLMGTDTVGGVWMFALELSRALSAQGVRVVLATMGKPVSAAQYRQAMGIPGLVLRESHYRLEWMDQPWAEVDAAGDWLLRLEREQQPDLIHLNHYSHGNLPWRGPCLVAGHSCVYSWWWAVHGQAPPPGWQTYHNRVRRGLMGAHRVIAPSAAMLASLQRHYGPLPMAGVIHNGRLANDFPPGAKQPFILSAGRIWDDAKNIGSLARVAPQLDWPLYLAGELRHPQHAGGSWDKLPNVLTLGQLSPRVLQRWYGHAAIYALPARYEPFGLSILEAALAGCAPVLGDIPSLRELWNGAARFVPPDDQQALRTALQQLINNPPQLQQLAHRARRRAHEYSTAAMASRYLRVYQQLLSSHSLPGAAPLKTSG